MSSPWRSKKAFLYFGGAFVIILGAVIVLNAPYNYVGYRAGENEIMPFTIHDRPGYYGQLEISVDLRPSNVTLVIVDFTMTSNETALAYSANFTLTEDDMLPGSNPPNYLARQTIDIPPGNYTVIATNVEGTGAMEIGLSQVSDSRVFIVIGGMMNIIGLFMGAAGYFVSGTLLPTGDEMIVDWGYDEDEKEDDYFVE